MKNGFTLIELLIVIAIIVILMTATLVALNPFRHFAQANNANRMSGINAILNAVSQRIADNKGLLGPRDGEGVGEWPTTDCPAYGDDVPGPDVDIDPVTPEVQHPIIGSGTQADGQYDLCDIDVGPEAGTGDDALVALYIAAMPTDPQYGEYHNCDDYNTQYTIYCENGRITICAPRAQLGETLCVTR